MTLDEVLDACVEAGVTHFELAYDAAPDGAEGTWIWNIDRVDPVKWYSVPKPWSLYFTWLGTGPDPDKPWGVLPFRIDWEFWTVGVHVGSGRGGWTGLEHDTFAERLRDALTHYLCDGEGSRCPHEVCEYHGDCPDEDWDY